MYLEAIVDKNGQIIKAVWNETGDPVNLVFDLKTEVAGQERCLISIDDATNNEIAAASSPEKSKLVYIVNNFLVDMTQEIAATEFTTQGIKTRKLIKK